MGAPGYTRRAAEYEQATRRLAEERASGCASSADIAFWQSEVHRLSTVTGPSIVSTGCANCGRPVDYIEDEDDGPLYCERCGI
jgi:hypothetical protein